jgi:hypothetical protein
VLVSERDDSLNFGVAPGPHHRVGHTRQFPKPELVYLAADEYVGDYYDDGDDDDKGKNIHHAVKTVIIMLVVVVAMVIVMMMMIAIMMVLRNAKSPRLLASPRRIA